MVTGYSVPIFHSVSSYIIHEFQKEFVVSGICNNIKSVRWDWPTNMFAINNFFICPQAHPGERHRVLNLYQDMSSRHLQDMSSRRLQDMSSRRLQDQQMFAGQLQEDNSCTFLVKSGEINWYRRNSKTSSILQLLDLLYRCNAQSWLQSYYFLLISGGILPWHHFSELDNYADATSVLSTLPYVEPFRMNREFLSQFITTIIVTPCPINDAIKSFHLLIPLSVTVRFVFTKQLQSVFLSASNAIKTWHDESLYCF